MDPSGKKDTVECQIEDKGNSSYRCTYKPTQEGQHIIYVTFVGGQISKSPYTVNVGEGKRRLQHCGGWVILLFLPSVVFAYSSISSFKLRNV